MSERSLPLTDVWRYVGIGRPLDEIVEYLAEQLAARIALSALLVKRFVAAERALITEGAYFAGSNTPNLPRRRELTSEQIHWLTAWFSKNTLSRCGPGSRRDLVRVALLPGVDGDGLFGPLQTAAGPVGLATVVAPREAQLTAEHQRLLKLILEPLSSSIANQRLGLGNTCQFEPISIEESTGGSGPRYKDLVDTIVGSRTSLKPILEQVDQVAATGAPVLIFGETGTGKEVIARVIHSRSDRSHGPMFRVNCGAIPPELVDSELFGHERGSFTGAVESRKGWFERANGGTLFLDEAGELPHAAQVRLLRVLQDGSLERVGGQRTMTVDVRVVAATNADLESMVAGGEFRKDLWYRISVFPIRLPPLRDRGEDIVSLAAHFADRAGVRIGGRPLVPTDGEIQLLMEYDWPGNVRELAAVVERAAILGGGKRLEFSAALGRQTTSSQRRSQTVGVDELVFPTLDQAMKRHIERALVMTKGRIEGHGGAAALLRINPHTLRARMRKLDLDWTRFRQG